MEGFQIDGNGFQIGNGGQKGPLAFEQQSGGGCAGRKATPVSHLSDRGVMVVFSVNGRVVDLGGQLLSQAVLSHPCSRCPTGRCAGQSVMVPQAVLALISGTSTWPSC